MARYLRQDDVCLGKFSLNISNCPSSEPAAQQRPPTPPSVLEDRNRRESGEANTASASEQKNSWIEQVTSMIASLVPKTHKISLSLDHLNSERYCYLHKITKTSKTRKLRLSFSCRFMPLKDYKTLQLKSSELQLSSGTVLVLDETAMKEGKLIDQGIFLSSFFLSLL
jgi:hypothetical protein